MSKERILNPGSKESMFSNEDISSVMSVRYPLSTGSPDTRMHDPMSTS